jgi:hypothetical protein
VPEWRASVDELSVSGSVYSNSAGVADYAATRETRVTTPNNYQYGGRLNAVVLYDDASLAWETRVRATLQRLLVKVEGSTAPPQEQADDIVGRPKCV